MSFIRLEAGKVAQYSWQGEVGLLGALLDKDFDTRVERQTTCFQAQQPFLGEEYPKTQTTLLKLRVSGAGHASNL